MTVIYGGNDKYSLSFNNSSGFIVLCMEQIKEIQNYDFENSRDYLLDYESLENMIYMLEKQLEDCENG